MRAAGAERSGLGPSRRRGCGWGFRCVVRGFRALSLAPRRGVWWSRRRARRRNALAPAQRFWVAMEAGRPRASGRLPARCLASVRSMPLAAHVDTTCTPSRKTRPTLSNRPRPSPSACNTSNQHDGSGGTPAPTRSRLRPRNAPTKPLKRVALFVWRETKPAATRGAPDGLAGRQATVRDPFPTPKKFHAAPGRGSGCPGLVGLTST